MSLYDYASLFRQNIQNKEYDKIDYLINYSDNLKKKYVELFKTNPISKLIQDPYVTLINVFKNKDIFIGLESQKPLISTCELPDIKSRDTFLFYFDLITENILTKVRWDNMVVAGDIPLLALLYEPQKDNIYDIRDDINTTYRDFELNIYLYGKINLSDKIKDTCRSIMNVMLFKPELINKEGIISLISQKHYPIINIHTTVYMSPAHILLTAPIMRSKKFLFDNKDLWTTPNSHYDYVYSLSKCINDSDDNIKEHMKLLRLGYGLDLTDINRIDINPQMYYKETFQKDIDRLIVQSKFSNPSRLHDIYKKITQSDNLSDDVYLEHIISDDREVILKLLEDNQETSFNPLVYAIVFNRLEIFNALLNSITDYKKPFHTAINMNRKVFADILFPKVSLKEAKQIIIENRDPKYISLIEDDLDVDDIQDIISTNDSKLINSVNLQRFTNIAEQILNISDFDVFKNVILENRYLVKDKNIVNNIHDDRRIELLRNLSCNIPKKDINQLELKLTENAFEDDPEIIEKYVNDRLTCGLTPFEYALVNDKIDIASTLLKYDIDHTEKDYIRLCAQNRSLRSIIFLNNYAKDIYLTYNEGKDIPEELDLGYIDESGNNILHYADDNKVILLINRLRPNLVNQKNTEGQTCISKAQNISSLETFLQLGADLMIRDYKGYCQFHHLIMNKTTDSKMIDACIRYYPNILDVCTEREHYSPLMLTICSSSPRLAEYMISRGANTNIRDIFGNAVDHYVVIHNSQLDTRLRYIKNIYDMTPHDYACRLGIDRYVGYDYDNIEQEDTNKLHTYFIEKISKLIKDEIQISYLI